MTPPLTDWEDELGRLLGHRLRTRAIDGLGTGRWNGADLEDAIAAAERRMTVRQRELLWQALTGDRTLSDAAARASRGEGFSLT